MHTEYHKWWSPLLRQDMELKVYGHSGKPMIVLPTMAGRFFDFEDQGMIEACRPWIDSGKLMLFAVDSVDEQSWANRSLAPADRNKRHNEYDQYVTTEVVPFALSYRVTSRSFLATGCGVGAFHAANLFFKHPDMFDGVIALAALLRLDRAEFGLAKSDLDDVYFNSPLAYLPGLSDPWFIDRYRKSQIILCCGQDAWSAPAVEDALEMRRVLEAKGVPCWVDLWGTDVANDWPWWRRQLPYFLEKARLG